MNLREWTVMAALATAPLAACVSETKSDALPRAKQTELDGLIAAVPFKRGAERKQTLDQISAFGRYALEPVQDKLLTSSDYAVRANAVYVLGLIFEQDHADGVLDVVRGAMRDPEPTVRLEAARVLLEGGDTSGVADLLAGLNDTSPLVRRNCFEALRGAIGRDYGYDPNADPSARLEAAEKFRAHFAQMRG